MPQIDYPYSVMHCNNIEVLYKVEKVKSSNFAPMYKIIVPKPTNA